VVVLDTSVLVESLTGSKAAFPALRRTIDSGEILLVPALVVYEWRRGPRLAEELAVEQMLFPEELYIPFSVAEGELSAKLYRSVSRPHSREIDIAIAACAIVREAELWTVNPADFPD
jgi:predicted nucleic acid-binding protein